MSSMWWIITLLVSAVLLLPIVLSVWYKLTEHHRRKVLACAKDDFHLRREWLEAGFLTAASKTGRPRGLTWADCDFHNDVSFARDRQSGELCALVGVAISFEAIEGGGMEDNPNVGNLKAGSAVFRHDGHKWRTDGRALLNLDPHEAIERLHNELETVD